MGRTRKPWKVLGLAAAFSGSLACCISLAAQGPTPSAGAAPLLPKIQDNGEIKLVAQEQLPNVPAPTGLDIPNIEVPTQPASQQQASPAPKLDSLGTPNALSTTQQGSYTPLSDVVSGGEAATRNTGDVGDLLRKSLAGLGVEVQQRTPVITDPHIRGYLGGQINTSADGGYYYPARPDLDTVVSRIDSSIVNNVIVIPGPYTVRLGPGFSFIDIETLGTPRYQDGFEVHGSTYVGYETNGQGWNGRQSFWGGEQDWGFRVGWNLATAVDYTTGSGIQELSGYNLQNLDFALGFDFTENLSLEVKYLRAMQRDVEYPGSITDVNSLVTDAFTARLVYKQGDNFRSTLDAWFNETRFDGDNLSVNKQNDSLHFVPVNGVEFPFTFNVATNGDNNSWGFRNVNTLGRDKEVQVSAGWDFRYISQAVNEFDTFFFNNFATVLGPTNAPLPRSHEIDPGLFLDTAVPIGDRFNLKAGTRVDFVTAAMQQPVDFPAPAVVNNVPLTPTEQVLLPLTAANGLIGLGPNALDQRDFTLLAAFATADYKLTEEISAQAGYGFSQRPPSLVELYGDGPFIAFGQNSGAFFYGSPGLQPEQLNQADVGIKANYETFRGGARGFYANIQDYITYAPVPVAPGVKTIPGLNGFRFVNTPLARLIGFETYAEYDVLDWLTPFGTLTYVSGRDISNGEPLPDIFPMDGRVGFRIHDADKKNSRWAVEFGARMVATQGDVAYNLGEVVTPGYTIYSIRAYWMIRKDLLLTSGIENLGNRNYQEAFDARSTPNNGFLTTPVYQPGFNFYVGLRWTY